MINSGHHPVVPHHSHAGPVIPPGAGGRHELKTPTNASVRASSVSAAKQERLEALRSERHRIMQMQTTILSRPRSVAGTPQAPIRSPSMGPRANPQPLVFQTHSSVPQDAHGPSNALGFEIDQLKQEISRLKLDVERYRTMQSKDHGRIKELETDLEIVSGERDRLQEQHQKDQASRGSESRRFAEIQNELNILKDRANPETLEKMNNEIKNLRSAISREKDRVFVLMTEKQQLEEQLNDVRTGNFKAEQIQSEVNSLRVQVKEFGEWKSEKFSLESQIESLKSENESLTKQLRSEKSQRLVLAARVDELQKYMENADTVIGTCDSNESQRGSLVSSIPPLNEADIPTRRNTMETDSFTPTRVVLPGVEQRSIDATMNRTPEKFATVDLLPPPISEGGSNSRRSTSLQNQPTLIAPRPHPSEPSFDDIEQRGSAKKFNESSARLGSLFDNGGNDDNDDGFGLQEPPALFIPPSSHSPRDTAVTATVVAQSPKNDISDIFGGPSAGVDAWHTKPQSPVMKYNMHDHAPPVEPPAPVGQQFPHHAQFHSQPTPHQFAPHVPVRGPVAPQPTTMAPAANHVPGHVPVAAFKPAQPMQTTPVVAKAPAHSLIRPQTVAVPQRGFSPAPSPAPTPQAPVIPVHPAFGGNRTTNASPGPFGGVLPATHQPPHPTQQVPQVPRPSGFPGSISSVTPPQNKVVNPQAGYNPYQQQPRYGNGPFR